MRRVWQDPVNEKHAESSHECSARQDPSVRLQDLFEVVCSEELLAEAPGELDELLCRLIISILFQKSVHERSKDHQCDICQVFVSQACYLKKHKEMLHPADGRKIRYQCAKCHLDFSTEHALRNHARIHFDPEFACEHCDKKFHKKANLLDHQEHHETLAFACPHCTRSFRKEAKLNGHLRNVHYKEKRTYRCELCSATFTRRTSYRDHALRQHKELDKDSLNDLITRISTMLPEELQ